MPPPLKLLNVGCGSRLHPAWVNIDKVGRGPDVRCCDIREGLPFGDGEFHAIYHSHLLEHLDRREAISFLRECLRVLQPSGIIRIAVPDLERIARLYLDALQHATRGEPLYDHRYDWMMLELYDQTVRDRSGGEMAFYLRNSELPHESFIVERLGAVAQSLISRRNEASGKGEAAKGGSGLFMRACRLLANPAKWRERLVRLLLGDEYELLKLGRFRRSGEIHRWMYDRYSLARLLTNVGFVDVRVVTPIVSRIPEWPNYNLDTDPSGTVYKPDSLSIEASKSSTDRLSVRKPLATADRLS